MLVQTFNHIIVSPLPYTLEEASLSPNSPAPAQTLGLQSDDQGLSWHLPFCSVGWFLCTCYCLPLLFFVFYFLFLKPILQDLLDGAGRRAGLPCLCTGSHPSPPLCQFLEVFSPELFRFSRKDSSNILPEKYTPAVGILGVGQQKEVKAPWPPHKSLINFPRFCHCLNLTFWNLWVMRLSGQVE